MANKLYEETHIQNIANAIREKTGKTDTMTISAMAGEISGIEAGGGSGGLEIPDGYNVGFYDGDSNPLTFMAVAQGVSINPPNYLVKSWHLEDGTTIEFPYTPNGDAIIYANDSTYAKTVYNHYSISAKEYPYLVIVYTVNGSRCYLSCYFAKTIEETEGYRILVYNALGYEGIRTYATISPINAENVVNALINENLPLTEYEIDNVDVSNLSYLLSNFETTITGWANTFSLNV